MHRINVVKFTKNGCVLNFGCIALCKPQVFSADFRSGRPICFFACVVGASGFCRLYECAVLEFFCKERVKIYYINKFSVVAVVGGVGFVENLLFRVKTPVFR